MTERHPECPPDGCDICQSDWPCAKLEGERSAKRPTYAELQAENLTLRQKISELEKRVSHDS